MMDRVRPFDEEFGENSNHLERRKSHSKPKPFTSKSLQEIDKDGNGIIDERELESYVEEHHHTIREKVLLKRVLYIVVGVLLVFAALISVGTYMIVELTKEVDVNDNDNVLRGGKDEQMVVTDTPKYYTTLQDIEKLTPAALNSLRRLSFVTANGKTHNYAVDGT